MKESELVEDWKRDVEREKRSGNIVAGNGDYCRIEGWCESVKVGDFGWDMLWVNEDKEGKELGLEVKRREDQRWGEGEEGFNK